jgi:hypothetical protein
MKEIFQTNFIIPSEANYQYREDIFFCELFQKKIDKLGYKPLVEYIESLPR